MQKGWINKWLFPVILMLGMTPASAQIFDKTKGKNVKLVLRSPVIVHATESKIYNERLATAFKNYWKVSPYELYSPIKDYEVDKNSAYAVFLPAIVGLEVRDHATTMNYPFYVYGEATSKGKAYGEAIICAFPINAVHYEFDAKAEHIYERAALRLPYIVYNLNDMVRWLSEKESTKDYIDSVQAKATRLVKKTLLIPNDVVNEWDVNPNATALFKNNLDAAKRKMTPIMHNILDEADISYGGKYKIMSAEEIMKLENSAEADKYALFLPAVDERKYMLAYDLKTKELLYYETTKASNKIKSKDFDRMNKVVGF